MRVDEKNEIETLFKVQTPLDPVENGHGFKGVLLRNKKSDKIQCHLCGEWFSLLGAHIARTHKMKPDDYRIKFDVPLGFPLCGISYSRKRSDIANRPFNLEMIKKWAGKNWRHLNKRKSRKRNEWTKSCLAVQNMNGACPAQMVERYVVVSEIVGHEASQRDILKYDAPLSAIIVRRHKNLNAFRKKNGFKIKEKSKTWSGKEIIAAIRFYAIKNHCVPSTTLFKSSGGQYPSWNSVKTIFGSWRKALSVAGFEHFYRKPRWRM